MSTQAVIGPVNITAVTGAPEGGPGVHNGREARNLAEKHRRDKLNASIQELATMVPHVADSTRRLDKTAVLRFATHGLRLQYVFGKSGKRRKRQALGEHNFDPQQSLLTDTLLQLLDSFFITLTCHGQIVLISSSVEHLLGHCQSDLYGQNLLQITHPEDQSLLRQQLIPHDIETIFGVNDYQAPPNDAQDSGLESDYYRPSSPQTDAHLADIDERLRADRRCFTVRLARASTRSESSRTYEIVKIDGCFRRSDCSAAAGGSFPIVSQLIRRSRSNGSSSGSVGGGGFSPHLLQHDAIAQAALHGISGNDIVLVAMARVIRPAKIINRLMEVNRLEYRTRHLIDGRIIDCDQRIGLVAGYLKDEVRNLSPFSFMHQDDVRWVIVALRQMYDCNSDYGESCYRLLTRNGNFIYLQTKGYLEIDKGTNKVHSFVCVNTLLSEVEGRRKVQEMKNKFSIIINAKIPTNSMQDVPASQNPQQLERIVLYLIENLQKRHNSCTIDEASPELENKVHRHGNTPPLALVPPEPASVKNSISKSVSIVNVRAARHINIHNKGPGMYNRSIESLSVTNKGPALEEQDVQTHTQIHTPHLHQRPTVLQMQAKQCEAAKRFSDQRSCTPLISPIATPDSPLTPEASSPSSTTSPYHSSSFPASQMLQQHISVLKRLHETTNGDYNMSQPAKRSSSVSSQESNLSSGTASLTASTSDIHSVISNSLKHIDESLHKIDVDTRTLCQQRSRLPSPVPPSINHQLDAIIMERQKQNEFLANIKNEYEVHVEQFPHSHPRLHPHPHPHAHPQPHSHPHPQSHPHPHLHPPAHLHPTSNTPTIL